MFYNICYYFLEFISFSFVGWCVETVACSITEKKPVLNRGFLIGPYCPIYGSGALLALLLLEKYYHDPIALFILAVVGASVLEYVTSYIMEKLFNARWWDYSHMKYNINGRICLQNAFLFGIMGLIFIYFVNPFYEFLLGKFSPLALEIVSCSLFVVFFVDTIVSFHVISRLKINTKILKDSSAEISEQVKQELRKERLLKKRLLNAFPGMKTNYGDAIIDTIRKVLDGVEKGIRKGTDKIQKTAKKTKDEFQQKIKKKKK